MVDFKTQVIAPILANTYIGDLTRNKLREISESLGIVVMIDRGTFCRAVNRIDG